MRESTLIDLTGVWLIGSATDFGGRGPGFKSGISHNDQGLSRVIGNIVKYHGRTKNKYFKDFFLNIETCFYRRSSFFPKGSVGSGSNMTALGVKRMLPATTPRPEVICRTFSCMNRIKNIT